MKPLLVLLCFFLAACSDGNLTRTKAEKMIREHNNYPQEGSIAIAKESFGSPPKGLCYNTGISHMASDVRNFEKLNLVTFQEYVKNFIGSYDYRCVVAVTKVILTPEGRKHLIKETPTEYEVKTHILDVDAVTGIEDLPYENRVLVHYNVSIKNLTPFFAGREVTYNKTQMFTKFDDGWRISD